MVTHYTLVNFLRGAAEVQVAGQLVVNSTAECIGSAYYRRAISFCSDTSQGFFPYSSSVILLLVSHNSKSLFLFFPPNSASHVIFVVLFTEDSFLSLAALKTYGSESFWFVTAQQPCVGFVCGWFGFFFTTHSQSFVMPFSKLLSLNLNLYNTKIMRTLSLNNNHSKIYCDIHLITFD